jgi:hypothetical protein
MMYQVAHPEGRNHIGITPDGSNPARGDPAITKLINDIKAEYDLEKQRAIAHEYQRQMTVRAAGIQLGVSSPGFNLVWPVVSNYMVFRGQVGTVPIAESELHFWLDNTKPPLGKGA